MKQFHIFKPGTYIADNGVAYSFSAAQLQATANAYDPAKHEAPIVVGHPRNDAPAYGWTKSLIFSDGELNAEPDQVDPAFDEMVAAGRFKKRSAAFYPPDAKNNPVPGVYYLRHIGFLGAQPPAVKGLKPVEFTAAEEGVIEFADWGDLQNASLWRRLREWFISEKGLDTADKIVPDYAVQSLEDDARAGDSETATPMPAYAESNINKGVTMPPAEIAAREKALNDQKAELDRRSAEFAERDIKVKAEEARQRRVLIVAFADTLIAAGKLLPAEKAGAVEFLAALPADTVVEFGEGDKKIKQPAADWFKSFLQALPKRVEFAEIGRPQAEGASVQFAAPAGYQVDTARLELHVKAVAYAAKNKVDYITAVQAVGN